MRIETLDIVNFKNIEEASLEFSGGVNCLLGMNGMGKSNLLEAIHFLCLARPMQSLPEAALPRHGSDMMMVKGSFMMDTGVAEKVSCGIVNVFPPQAKHCLVACYLFVFIFVSDRGDPWDFLVSRLEVHPSVFCLWILL